jgi:hypothetical protein
MPACNNNFIIACKGFKRKFDNDGSLVLCILSKLLETDAGLASSYENQCVSLSQIVDEFSGLKCSYLIGKPKMFFFLDDGTTQDHSITLPIQASFRYIIFWCATNN